MQLCRNHAASRRAPETIGSSAGTHENANAHQNWLQLCPPSQGSLRVPWVDFVAGSRAAFWSTFMNLSDDLFDRCARSTHRSLPMRVSYEWNRPLTQIRTKSRRRQAPIQFLKIESHLSKSCDHPTSAQSVEANGRKSATRRRSSAESP